MFRTRTTTLNDPEVKCHQVVNSQIERRFGSGAFTHARAPGAFFVMGELTKLSIITVNCRPNAADVERGRWS
jgi:hypothetical protein